MCFLVPHSRVRGSLLVTAHLGLSHTAQAASGRKNLESKQTGAGGSHGTQKEMSHPNSQSRAVAEWGAEPGPAAHQPGQNLGRILILTFQRPCFIPLASQISPVFPFPRANRSHSYLLLLYPSEMIFSNFYFI